eukprot:5149486-Karenia_brevis.AAC.1
MGAFLKRDDTLQVRCACALLYQPLRKNCEPKDDMPPVGELEDEDAPPPDVGFPGECFLQMPDLLLPESIDGLARFNHDVETLLSVFCKKQSLSECCANLKELPQMHPEVARLGPRALLIRIRKVIEAVRDSSTTGQDAIHMTMPWWLCHDYRLCVLCEAVSRSTAIPSIFYMDSFRCAALSLLHKEVHVVSSGYISKNRPWFCAVGDPGTGKSHAAEPHADIVQEVCAENSFYAPGNVDDQSHIVMSRTYAAFEDKIRMTMGYGLKLSGEGAEYLCPTYPSQGKFDGDHGLVFDKLMDAAYGKSFGGETKTDRDAAKRAKKTGDPRPIPFMHHTNIQVGLIIQDSVWTEWWGVSECKRHKGLASRFTFPFAKGRMIGPLKYRNFFQSIYRPIVKDIFTRILTTWGPKVDVSQESKICGTFTFQEMEEKIIENVRVVCKQTEGSKTHSRQKFITGLSKAGYWLPGVAWENAIFSSAADCVFGLSQNMQARMVIPYNCLVGAAYYLVYRYLPGQVILDNDIQRCAWCKQGDSDPRDVDKHDDELDIKNILLQCPAHVLTCSLIGHFCSPKHDSLLSKNPTVRQQAVSRIEFLFHRLQEFGFGQVRTSSEHGLCFHKKHFSHMTTFCRNLLLQQLRIPAWIFGSHLPSNTESIPSGPQTANSQDVASHCEPKKQKRIFRRLRPCSPISRAPPSNQHEDDVANSARQNSSLCIASQSSRTASSDGESDKKFRAEKIDWDMGLPLPVPEELACEMEALGNSTQALAFLKSCTKHYNIHACWKPGHHVQDFFRYRADCIETRTCPVKYLARVTTSTPAICEIHQFHKHEHAHQEVGHGSIFLSARAALTASRYAADTHAGTCTTAGLQAAFNNAGVPRKERPNEHQMQNWVKRTNSKAKADANMQVGPQRSLSVLELQSQVTRYLVPHFDAILEASDIERLYVLNPINITPRRGFVPFTCKGMLDCIRRLDDNFWLIATDAKVSKKTAPKKRN